VLGQKVGAPVYHEAGLDPVTICKNAWAQALELKCDTIIFDTAGRLTIDETLMAELSSIKEQTKPDMIFLVCDAMMGQDAVTTAKAFHERLGLDGFIMTKLDGDARGGAALSIKEVTGAPIKFLGTGEELDRLEVFRPQGLASRILGMGDIVGLMKDFERVSKGDQEEETLRLLSGNFNLKDFYEQIAAIQQMGSLKDLMAKLPMQNLLPPGVNVDDRELGTIRAMIDSMTEKERLYPDCINVSRAGRIAKGSGRKLKDVQELVKKFKDMRGMMGKLGKNMGGLLGKIPGMKGLSQLNQMRKLASAARGGAGGGVPDLGALGGGAGGLGGMMPPGFPGFDGGLGAGSLGKRPDRDKLKKARKAAKKNRQKNRKK
jgi:signal recognition particle subunit SRP54